jgi:hypothetical protein
VSLSDQPNRNGPDRSQSASPAELGFLFSEVLDLLPEFLPRYLEIAAAGDDDPGEPTVLMAMAEFVADRLEAATAGEQVLGRALGLVEALAAGSEDDVDKELVSYAFLDSFTFEDRQLLLPGWARSPADCSSRSTRRNRAASGGNRHAGCAGNVGQRSWARWACSAAAMTRPRSPPTSSSVSVRSGAQKRRRKARLRAPSGTEGPR